MKRILTLILSLLMATTFSAERWNGIMIDVSRHFMPMEFLYRQVDAMSHFGINRLHLHLTDAAGWRLEIKSRPRLTSMAAWRTDASWKTWWNDGRRLYSEEKSDTAFGGYYTQEEMRRLVAYADSRGVQIVPEIEFPAHSEEVTAAYPETGCTGKPYECADFCLGSEASYTFMNDVLSELNGIFTSPYIHLGGDEAGGTRWLTCERCLAKMKELGIAPSARDSRQRLQQYASQRLTEMADKAGRKVILWDEALPPTALDTSAIKPIIMVWRDESTAARAMAQGHEVILCPGKHCYVDTYQDCPLTEPEAIGGYIPLDNIWAYARDVKKRMTDSLLLGMQVNLWTEYVPNDRHAERMLWPRALAVSAWADDNDYTPRDKGKVIEALNWLRQHDITPFPLESEVGERQEHDSPVRCLSTGKKVKYNAPYNEYYSAGGSTALTDGLRGGWANNDGRWQGFISRGRLDVTIDLEQTERIKNIEADFLQSIGPEIFLPEEINIYTSTDGENYTLLHHDTPGQSTVSTAYETMGWKAGNTATKRKTGRKAGKEGATKARYVRIQALSGKRGGWIFTDEIVVR